jgi:hypothetical protein
MALLLLILQKKGGNMYKENSLNKMLATIGVAAALSLGAASAYAQAPRSHTVGVTKGDQKVVATGWSVKKDIIMIAMRRLAASMI